MSATLHLAIELISRPSVTPNDAGCQHLLAERLQPLGFTIEHLPFGKVNNLWATHGQHTSPLLVLAGHTDVVPPGPLTAWRFSPFTPTLQDGLLYGRGAADMKGSLAAMITACERFVTDHPDHPGTLGILLTSDEEGEATEGTVKVIDHLQKTGQKIDWCVVGEPSSQARLGDMVKNGRRGSLNGLLTIHGTQGHVAYPHLADNPIHRFTPVLQRLCQTEWDHGNAFFPPTSFQISNLHAGTGADNVIPGELEVLFNFRYSTEVTHIQLQNWVTTLLDEYHLKYSLTWRHSGSPFLTPGGKLLEVTQQAISEVCGYDTQLSTAGGTSDGRFIAPTGAQVIEIGPLNATIHKVNECVNIDDLEKLSVIYQRIVEKLLVVMQCG
jgi:succinyl-diaminopimelate desuccinylase